METLIQIDALTKTYTLSRRQRRISGDSRHRLTAVDHLSLDVYRGEIFGLLGPNGAGKTTTLRMLATLIRPDSGDALIDSCSVVSQPEAVRQRIGFLTSDLKLEDFFTPNYLFDFFSQLHHVEPEVMQQRKQALFSRFGIDRYAEVKVRNLSTGMRQKTSLVVSLVHDPAIVIFDEPTNGLDVLTARTVTDYLAELKAEGKTIVLSTHIFSLVERLCDRVGIIIDGRLAACDTLQNVCNSMSLEDRFFEIYKAEKGGEW